MGQVTLETTGHGSALLTPFLGKEVGCLDGGMDAVSCAGIRGPAGKRTNSNYNNVKRI